ncbi:MAG: hypothetical protein V1922_05875 [bacterium]
MEWKYKMIRIVIALIVAFVLTVGMSDAIFINHSPQVNTHFFATLPQDIGLIVSSVISKFSVPITPISPTNVPPQQTNDQMVFAPSLPTITGVPTQISTLIPSLPPPPPTQKPTIQPTNKPAPLPTSPSSSSCPTTSNNTYTPISVASGHTPSAATHPDINIAVRGFSKTNETLSLTNVGGDDDAGRAPQFSTLFAHKRGPQFVSTYQVNGWNWDTNSRGGVIDDPPVTLLGISAKAGESVHVPISQYDIGDGKQVMVLYASPTSITIKYTREDDIIKGYAVHIDGICVDPQLLKLYSSLNGTGRSSLPGLAGGQQLGIAMTSEVRVAVRDTGSFMDPRVRKDWWVGY